MQIANQIPVDYPARAFFLEAPTEKRKAIQCLGKGTLTLINEVC